MYERNGVFIDNEVVSSAGAESVELISPATEEPVGICTLAVAGDIDRAVRSARRAFDEGPWPRMAHEERRRIVARTAGLLAEKSQELAELVTRQNGVNIKYQQGVIASRFDYYGALECPEPEYRDIAPGTPAKIVREPVGVVGAIVPWNAPASLGLSKVIPALMAGCTVVLKPSPETPLHDYVIAEAFAEAGLPSGVLNVVPADREASEELVKHPGIDMISFTGSTAAGRRVGAICGENIKRTVLELGGKSAAIIMDDMPAEMAAMALHTGMLLNNGQACMAWTRLLVPRSRHDELVEAFVAVLEAVKVGDPMDPNNDIGPLVAERQRDRVEGYIASGLADGARIAIGGGRPAGFDKGWYVEPTLFVGVNNSMKISREEIFGPVGTVIVYDDVDEAVRIANDSNYGLSGGIFTADPDRALDIAGQIRAGTVGINSLGVGNSVPFGGYKDSGVGRSHGPEGYAEFFEIKTIGLPSGYQFSSGN